MRTDWNRARFKETGKTTFLANYWPFVGAFGLAFAAIWERCGVSAQPDHQ